MDKKVVDLDNYRNQKELRKVDALDSIIDELSTLTNPAQEIELFKDEDYDKAQEFFTFLQVLEDELDRMYQNGIISEYNISTNQENKIDVSIVPVKSLEFISIDLKVGEDD